MYGEQGDRVRFGARYPGKFRFSVAHRSMTVLLGVVLAGFAELLTLSCATPVANLEVIVPSSVTVGQPFTVTVTAMDGGSLDTMFDSYIRFSSSDSAAILPGDYQFTAADRGSHTFTGGVTLTTAGRQTVTAFEIFAPSINGNASLTVSSASSDHI